MMKKIASFVFLLVAMTFISQTVNAEDVQYRKKTVIDFDEVLLEGELKKPASQYIKERTEKEFKTLIRVREDFEEEMFKSVDVLK